MGVASDGCLSQINANDEKNGVSAGLVITLARALSWAERASAAVQKKTNGRTGEEGGTA